MPSIAGLQPKAVNIGLHAISGLATLSCEKRYELLADGLPIILVSAQDLMSATETLKQHGRAADMLERQAGEEAAKILILLDYLRCPPGRSDRASMMLKNFYNHGARLLYDESCTWKPTDIAMLRQYIDAQRRSHYVQESLNDADIFPNWNLHIREAALYADLGRNESGELGWSDPILWGSEDRLKPNALIVSEAMRRLGFFKPEALKYLTEIWSKVNFTDREPHSKASELTATTLNLYIDEGIVLEEATDEDVSMVQMAWQMPMYDLDFKPINVPLEELIAEQSMIKFNQP